MRVNVSEVQDFDECPQLWYFKWILHRGLGKQSEAMQDGTYAHQVLELMMLGGEPSEHPEWQQHNSPLAPARMRALNKALLAWQERFSISRPWEEVLTTEEPMAIERAWGTLVGTPDACVRAFGKLWHVQHKRIGQNISPEAKARLVEVSLHEGVYPPMIERRFGEEVGGTMLNLVRHLSEKRVNEDPQQALHLDFLPLSASAVEEALYDVDVAVERMRVEEVRRRPYRNRAQCMGPFQNSPCEYYDACWRGVDILDDAWYTTVDPGLRYQGMEDGSENT